MKLYFLVIRIADQMKIQGPISCLLGTTVNHIVWKCADECVIFHKGHGVCKAATNIYFVDRLIYDY